MGPLFWIMGPHRLMELTGHGIGHAYEAKLLV